MAAKSSPAIAVIGIDIGKNSFRPPNPRVEGFSPSIRANVFNDISFYA